jgi:hypothetical protein
VRQASYDGNGVDGRLLYPRPACFGASLQFRHVAELMR